MIAYLCGKLLDTWDKSCIVLTKGGVGYRVLLPGHTFSQLPASGEEVQFYISMVVREDAQELFGFATFEERCTFDILTGINKVGARTALAILAVYRPTDLQRIVLDADINALTRVTGIGQKTAQHILLELKYKLGNIQTGKQSSITSAAYTSAFTDVMAAMANLGYSEDECAHTVKEIFKKEPDLDVSSAIRLALKALAKRKS